MNDATLERRNLVEKRSINVLVGAALGYITVTKALNRLIGKEITPDWKPSRSAWFDQP